MIKEWSVSNFKSIRDRINLKLNPLTILAGPNSSGKSTLIQSMLMVSQTLSDKIDSRPVVLNGGLTELGHYDDIQSVGGGGDCISFAFKCAPAPNLAARPIRKMAMTPKGPIHYGPKNADLGEISCEFSFDSPGGGGREGDGQHTAFRQLRLLGCSLETSSRSNQERVSEIDIHRRASDGREAAEGIAEFEDERWRQGLSFEVQLDEDSNLDIKSEYMSAHPKGCMIRHFLPRRIVYQIDGTMENANAITQAVQYGLPQAREQRSIQIPEPRLGLKTLAVLRNALKGVVDVEKLFPELAKDGAEDRDADDGISLRDWYEALLALPQDSRIKAQHILRADDSLFDRVYESIKRDGERPQHLYIQDRPPEPITIATWYLSDFFAKSVRYLAPLRTSPRSLYPQGSMADPMDIGIEGGFTASILEAHKDRKISYMPPSAFADSEIAIGIKQATLGEAVNQWLDYLGLADSIQCLDLGKVGHSLRVSQDGNARYLDLTHVGIGVSQVLPVLVLALATEADSTLLLEQPELHLHPKTQTLLADFFISLALAGKQCIVETHSEYIVDRLRYRIASCEESQILQECCGLYFVEKRDGSSRFRKVEINDYGAIEDWPEGFFDQSYRQSANILRAAQRKRVGAGN